MIMKPTVKIFKNLETLSLFVAEEFLRNVKSAADRKKPFTVALAGGSTPETLYRDIARLSEKQEIPWDMVHFFWGDERCVPPDSSESNFGMANNLMLSKLAIPEDNIHRIHGEEEPPGETERYAQVLQMNVPVVQNGIPQMDWVFLGMGSDGHTASLFPESDVVQIRDKFCAVSQHPESGQKRITLTLPVLNNASRVSFLIAGDSKSQITEKILQDPSAAEKYPAAMVQPQTGQLEWFIDRDAAVRLPM